MLKRIAIGCLAVLLAELAPPARADLSIFVQDTTVTQGGYGVLNIWLGGDSNGPNDFNNYSFELQIGGGLFLQFAPNPSSPSGADSTTQSYSYLSAANYIFN